MVAREVVSLRTYKGVFVAPLVVHTVRAEYLCAIGRAVAVRKGAEVAVHHLLAIQRDGLLAGIAIRNPYMPAPDELTRLVVAAYKGVTLHNLICGLVAIIFGLSLCQIERYLAIAQVEIVDKALLGLPQELDALGLELYAIATSIGVEDISCLRLVGDVAVGRRIGVIHCALHDCQIDSEILSCALRCVANK